MNNNIYRKSINDISPIIYEIVSAGGSVRLDVKGNSMKPLLRSERDSVVLKKVSDIKKYDVVLFRTQNGRIALHRIIDIDDSVYTIAGDNQFRFNYDVKHDDLIAKAVEFHRGKRCLNETQINRFGAFWFAVYPLRRITRKGLSWIKRHLPACIRSFIDKYR